VVFAKLVPKFNVFTSSYNRSPAPKHAKNIFNTTTKIRNKFIKSSRINKAVAAIQRGEFTYYTNIAREFKYNRSTISRRIRSLIKSKKEANSFCY
jgi:DNA invertase Pin-like site-specific DNA recombinase